MKKRVIIAVIIAIISFALYPILNDIAVIERGYDAFGGEELVTIFGLVAAAFIFPNETGKKCRAVRPKANRPTTESEQSNNHFDA